MLSFTSSIGPLPTAGSSAVIAVSCSSTSQPSYPRVEGIEMGAAVRP
jgi:hypothetical protein